MSITITADAEAKIREKVESGRYASAEEVIAEALRLLDEDEQAKLERLRGLIDDGFAGPFTPLTRESWADGLERAKQRFLAGERPDSLSPAAPGNPAPSAVLADRDVMAVDAAS